MAEASSKFSMLTLTGVQFTLYFAILLAPLFYVLRRLWSVQKLHSRATTKGGESTASVTQLVALVFVLLGVCFLGNTWYHILSFAFGNFNASGLTFAEWLRLDDNRLTLAYERVSLTPAHWWLSGQFLNFVAIAVIFLAVEAARRRIPHAWAFVCVGL